MKCLNCGSEFEGKFCPNCGTPSDIQQNQQPEKTKESLKDMLTKKDKTGKPFYKKAWFIILAIIVVIGIVIGIVVGVTSNGKKIEWSHLVLGDVLPEPPSNRGKVIEDSEDELWVSILKVSDKQYKEYVKKCENKGFNIDAETSSSSYKAYNSEGYHLDLWYDGKKEMDITLKAPMKLTTIEWPTSAAGNLLPIPKSLEGVIDWEHEDSFYLHIGNTTIEEFNQYVNECMNKGFNVEYDKGDNYFYASHKEGYRVSINYEGFNIMSIQIEKEEIEEIEEEVEDITEEVETAPESKTVLVNGMRKEFKDAMDSYEEFYDTYIEFMKSFDAGNASMLAKYSELLSKQVDVTAKFEKWQNSQDMNEAELAYFVEVQARVAKKLLELSSN